jgi:methylated-DNA-protein-cysteine methyltransferase-like protein
LVNSTSWPAFFTRVINIIKRIPRGKVATYGQIAAYAGNHRAARQVAYVLHSSSDKEDLPWQRVINSRGTISLKPRHGYELQKRLLRKEGVVFNKSGAVNLRRFLWLASPMRRSAGEFLNCPKK